MNSHWGIERFVIVVRCFYVMRPISVYEFSVNRWFCDCDVQKLRFSKIIHCTMNSLTTIDHEKTRNTLNDNNGKIILTLARKNMIKDKLHFSRETANLVALHLSFKYQCFTSRNISHSITRTNIYIVMERSYGEDFRSNLLKEDVRRLDSQSVWRDLLLMVQSHDTTIWNSFSSKWYMYHQGYKRIHQPILMCLFVYCCFNIGQFLWQ
jgi:hypothetical protein